MRRRPVTFAVLLGLLLGTDVRTQHADPEWSRSPLEGPVERFALSPDGRFAATLGGDGRCTLWRLEDLAVVDSRTVQTGLWPFLVFSPDSTRFACVPAYWFDSQVWVWDTEKGEPLEGMSVQLQRVDDRRRRNGEEIEVGPRLWSHPDGTRLFVPGEWRKRVLLGTGGRLVDAAPQFRQRFHCSADGTAIALLKPGGHNESDVPPGPKHRDLRIEVRSVEDGSPRNFAAYQEIVDHAEEWFDHVWACDFQRFFFVREGVVRVHRLADPEAEVASFGRGVTALAWFQGVIFTGHGDGAVRAWRDGEVVRTLASVPGPVDFLLPRGEVVIASVGRELFASTEGGVVARRAEGSGAAVLGRRVALRDGNGNVGVWDDGTKLGELQADQAGYRLTDNRHVPILLGGDVLAYRADSRLHFVDARSLEPRGDVGGHAGRIGSVQWKGDRLLVTGAGRAAVLLADTGREESSYATGQVALTDVGGLELTVLAGETTRRDSVAVGSAIVAIRARDRVHVVHLPTGQKRVLEAPGSTANALAISDDDRRLAFVQNRDADPSTLELHDLVTDERVGSIEVKSGFMEDGVLFRPGTGLAGNARPTPDHRGLEVAVQEGRFVHLYDELGALLHRLESGPWNARPGVRSFAFTPDGRHLAAVSYERHVAVYDLEARVRVVEFEAPRKAYSHFANLVMSPTSDSFAAHYPERDLVLWVSIEGEVLATLEDLPGRRAPTFLPDGRLLVVGHDATEVWDRRGRSRPVAPPAEGPVAVSPDGQRIALAQRAKLGVWRVSVEEGDE